MSAGVVGVLALPRKISNEIVADLSDCLSGEWVYYDDADLDLGGEYSEAGQQIVDQTYLRLTQHFGMPVVYRKQWLDYWNAGYNVAMTLEALGLRSSDYEGRNSRFQICEDIGDLEKLKRQVKSFLRRRRRAMEDKWLHSAILEAATSWTDVVGPCSLIVYGEAKSVCLSDDGFKEPLGISWKNGAFVHPD